MSDKRDVTLPAWEYNILMNEYGAYERALATLLDERGVNELVIGNVYLYRADGGVGTWFVDADGNKLGSVDYAFADKGVMP